MKKPKLRTCWQQNNTQIVLDFLSLMIRKGIDIAIDFKKMVL